jgi:hypothetical protein
MADLRACSPRTVTSAEPAGLAKIEQKWDTANATAQD